MASRRDDDYLRLKQSVDEWVAEVTLARSALAQTLRVHVSPRPAFTLRPGGAEPSIIAGRPDAATFVTEQAAPGISREVRDDLHRRANEAEHRAREAEGQLTRLQAELEFAREQLHLQNRLRSEAVAKQANSERDYEETVHALGRAQISVDELRRQLRGKEWALEKAMTALEARTNPAGVPAADVEMLQREAAALHSRLETLTLELQTAREHATRERDVSLAAQQRLEKIEAESARSKEIVEGLSSQVQAYAEELRATGRELDQARAAIAPLDVPRAADAARTAGQRVADAELSLQLAERRADDLARALESSERESLDRLSESIADAAVLSDNYDALAESHMSLRDEVVALQQQIIPRDHDLARLQVELEALRGGKGADGGGDDATHDDQRMGQEMLTRALWGELESTRETLERAEMDHALLRKALVAELNGLRELAAERDFVIHHQAEQIDASLSEVSDGRPESETPDVGREAVMREIQILRQRIDDKDALVRRLRGELAEAEEKISSSAGGETTALMAELRNRELDLDRASQRVAFLRRLLAKNASESRPMERIETTSSSETLPQSARESMNQLETPRVSSPDDIDVSRYQANAEIQREVEQSLAHLSWWPLIAVVGVMAGLSALGLAVLVFLFT